MINTKDKFYKPPEKKELRQSKTELKHGQYKYHDKDEWKNLKNNPYMQQRQRINRQESSSYKKKMIGNPYNPLGSLNAIPPNSKKEMAPNKFSYSFQPVMVPSYPSSKHTKTSNLGLGLAYMPLPKANSLLKIDLLPLKM